MRKIRLALLVKLAIKASMAVDTPNSNIPAAHGHVLSRPNVSRFKVSRFKASWLYVLLQMWLIGNVQPINAAALPSDAASAETIVAFIETDEANCLVNEGKMISLKLLDLSAPVEVWVDRWYMNVQTADHTKQRLTPEQAIAELGCSRTYAGPQHWTIYSIKRMPALQ